MRIREGYLKISKVCACLDADKNELFERYWLIICEGKMNSHMSGS